MIVDLDDLRTVPYQLGQVVTVSLKCGGEITGRIMPGRLGEERNPCGCYFVEQLHECPPLFVIVHETQLTPVAGNGEQDE